MIEVVFFKRTSLFTCVRWHYGSLTEDKEKAGSAKVNKTGHVKKVTVTTNNRTQAGFNSARRKKAKHWTQNQFTNRMHNYQKNTNLFGNVQNVLFHLD